MLSAPSNCASDEQFKRSLEGDIYKENVGATRYILCKLAEISMTQEKWTDLWQRTDKKVFVWTIEHIFPEGENIPQCWIDMIADGNKQLAKEYLEEYLKVPASFYDHKPQGTFQEEYFAMKYLGFEKVSAFRDAPTKRILFFYDKLTWKQSREIYPT